MARQRCVVYTVAEMFAFSAGENTPHKAKCLRSTGRQYRQRRFYQRRVFQRGCCRVLPLLTTEHRKAVAAEDGFWPSNSRNDWQGE
ncbi:MAG: hypothetical protein CV087_09355 [Candidatus Brocadia sp. WS118]|nr:MAG: hypothetical protein CV087_09355 [Candidatus Brocadia sp. WS118]